MADIEGPDDMIIMEDGDDALKIAKLNLEASTILISLGNLRIAIKSIEANFRNYQKETVKLIRSLKKNQRNRVLRKGGVEVEKKDREPSGFAKKTKVRKELIDFMRRPDVAGIIETIMTEEDLKTEGSKFEPLDDDNMINRPSATKIINRYIKEKGLYNPTNRKAFLPDDALGKILNKLDKLDKNGGGYKFFNLQKYIKHLFL